LQVLLDVDRLRVCYRQKEVACHVRVYGCNKWQLQPDHYLEVLRQRPQAFDSARPLKQWRAHWPSCFERLLEHFCERHGRNHGIKEFLSVLLLHREHSGDELEAAVELALEAGVSCSDGVKHVLCHTGPEVRIEPLEKFSSFPAADVSIYTQLHPKPPQTAITTQTEAEAVPETDTQFGFAYDRGGDTS
jgi:hypothetical protein